MRKPSGIGRLSSGHVLFRRHTWGRCRLRAQPACSIIDCRPSSSRRAKRKEGKGRDNYEGCKTTRKGHSNRRPLTPVVDPRQGRYYPRLFGLAKAGSRLEETFRRALPSPEAKYSRRRVPSIVSPSRTPPRRRSQESPRAPGLAPPRSSWFTWPMLAPRLFRPQEGQILRFQTPHVPTSSRPAREAQVSGRSGASTRSPRHGPDRVRLTGRPSRLLLSEAVQRAGSHAVPHVVMWGRVGSGNDEMIVSSSSSGVSRSAGAPPAIVAERMACRTLRCAPITSGLPSGRRNLPVIAA